MKSFVTFIVTTPEPIEPPPIKIKIPPDTFTDPMVQVNPAVPVGVTNLKSFEPVLTTFREVALVRIPLFCHEPE